MTVAPRRRGGPLVALGAVLALWVAGRIIVVGMTAPTLPGPTLLSQPGQAFLPRASQGSDPRDKDTGSLPAPTGDMVATFVPEPLPASGPPPAMRFEPVPRVWQPAPMRGGTPAALPARIAAGHQMMWMAALSRMPLPGLISGGDLAPRPLPAPFFQRNAASVPARRWSADGWLLLRSGSGGSPGLSASPASYGASQAGAVVRYRLAPHSAVRPEAYARIAAALEGATEKELAAGLSMRPLARVPLRAMAELRVSDQTGGTRIRPAALVVTEVAPVELPYETRAEFYGQAGYVGGRFATAFADGQARITRRVASIGDADLRAGAGAWAGAQKGAARFDIGPSATLGLPVGDGGAARVGLDWRLRVAGDAQPGSGVALTLSAGF